jgi:uncharacterized protein
MKQGKRFGIILIPTWSCSNTCDHCFEKLLPQTVDPGFWRLFFERARVFTEHERVDRLVVYWQGGEVLTMPPAEVERGLRTGERLFEGSGTAIEHHLQTNLMPYRAEWRDVIAHYFNGSISSSLDFPNVHRSTREITVADYTKAWLEKKGEAESDGFIVNLITLPNPSTFELGAARFYDFYSEEVRVKNLQINFPFPGVRPDRPARLDRDRLRGFMHELYRLWVAGGRVINLNPFAPLEDRILYNDGTLPCALSYSCARYLVAIGPDGEVGQCDCWLSTRKRHRFGYLSENTLLELLGSPARKPFLGRALRMIEDAECGACQFWSICYGGCPLRAFTFTGDFFSRDYYCPVYRSMCEDVVAERHRAACELAMRPIADPGCRPLDRPSIVKTP